MFYPFEIVESRKWKVERKKLKPKEE